MYNEYIIHTYIICPSTHKGNWKSQIFYALVSCSLTKQGDTPAEPKYQGGRNNTEIQIFRKCIEQTRQDFSSFLPATQVPQFSLLANSTNGYWESNVLFFQLVHLWNKKIPIYPWFQAVEEPPQTSSKNSVSWAPSWTRNYNTLLGLQKIDWTGCRPLFFFLWCTSRIVSIILCVPGANTNTEQMSKENTFLFVQKQQMGNNHKALKVGHSFIISHTSLSCLCLHHITSSSVFLTL